MLGLFASNPLSGQPNVLNRLSFDPIATGLDLHVAITHAGDASGRLFITLQRGQIVIHDGTTLRVDPFLDIRSRVACCGERGLLSAAFHPDFESNGFFFVYYTNALGDTVVSRFRVSGDPNVADPNSQTVLLTVDQPFGNHNGGQMQFGPDGFLYIGLGDGGSAGDPGNRAQDLRTLLGKILRIDVDRGSPFAVPATNPFVGTAGARPEIWAFGLRNPWRFSFDRKTRDLFIGDVGQNRVEEIDFQPGSSPGGENYGWRRLEGSRCFEPSSGCSDPSFTGPILEYQHVGGNCGGSVTAGYRYRGVEFPQLHGVYFYADFCTTRLYAATEADGRWTAQSPRSTGFSISAFGEDEAGELYLADRGAGVIYRITTDRPMPAISTLSPGTAVAGSSAFALTITGSNFVPASVVRWNGGSRPTTFLDNSRLQASISASDLSSSGVAQVSVFTPAPGGGTTETLEFMVLASPAPTPRLNEGGVVEAAGYSTGMGVAPGSIAAVFGSDLATGAEMAISDPLPVSLGGATLSFNGSLAVPMFFVNRTQMNIQIPWELEGFEEATLTDAVGGEVSQPVVVPLTRFSPGLFSLDASGSGQGAIVIAGTGGTIAAPVGAFPNSRPARQGESLAIFATGLGPVNPTPPTGTATPQEPLSETTSQPQVTIGEVEVPVSFSGLSPGSVALYQVNVEVRSGVPSGNVVPVTLTIGGKQSNTVTVAVE